MKKLNGLLAACLLLLMACKKSADNEMISTPEGIDTKVETANGITYRVFTQSTLGAPYKGILVINTTF